MDRIEARLPAVIAALVGTILVVLLLAACSSGSESEGSDSEPSESAYAQCLRENGAVPPADGEDFDPDGLAAAQAACADVLPEGAPEEGLGGGFAPPGASGLPGGGGAPSPEQAAALLECLRDQGLELPDDAAELPGALDPSDPATQEALGACFGGGPFGP